MSYFSFKTPFLIHGGFLSFFIALGFFILLGFGYENRVFLFINDFMSLKYFGLPLGLRLWFGILNWFSISLVLFEVTLCLVRLNPLNAREHQA